MNRSMGLRARTSVTGWLVTVVAGVLLSGCTGSTTTAAPGVPAGHTGSTTQAAPVVPATHPESVSYVDVTDDHPALADAAHASGQRRFVLSFILSQESACTPVWGDDLSLNDQNLGAQIGALRQSGGTVRVASGGETGSYLETACPDAGALAAAYTAAVDATGADQFEVDIERRVPAELVADALTQLQQSRRIGITVTVGVVDAQGGIDPRTMPVLRALAARGTVVTVNAMLMNFPYQGSWRDALLQVADTVTRQLQQLWPGLDQQTVNHRLGLTMMAGRNDTGPITTLDDVQALRTYAEAHGVAQLGLWSLGRDNGSCPGRHTSSNTCSGIEQNPYDFTIRLSGGQ